MGITRVRELDIDVVQAARQRIINAFSNGCKVYLSCSGGKDSIVMMDITYKLILEGKINPAQLEAVFIDEESMYDDVIDIVKIWRKRFLMAGAKFTWFCMEYRQMNCLHSLEETETFVCWDRFQRDKWCRPMPPFAVTSHPLLKPRQEVYQTFTKRLMSDGITLVGVRVAESVQRRKYIANVMNSNSVTNAGLMYPIYDFKDADIWLYIKLNNLEYPKAYEEMYACGVSRNRLRISNFFGIDACAVLSKLYEYRPGLAEKVLRREPNAYLVQMYWDTEMFKRSTKTRRELEKQDDKPKDYKALALDICKHPENYTDSKQRISVINAYKKMIIKHCGQFDKDDWKKMYESLMAGDAKKRTLRAIEMRIGSKAVAQMKKENR